MTDGPDEDVTGMTCAWCWTEASRRVLVRGGEISSHYYTVMAEQEEMGAAAQCPMVRAQVRLFGQQGA